MTVNQELVQAIAREVIARIEERNGAPSSGPRRRATMASSKPSTRR